MSKLFFIILFTTTPYLCECKALLQSSINALAVNNKNVNEIAPGSTMQLVVQVENVGDQESMPAEIFVRYAFPKPLIKEKNSILYQSETESLPLLKPGEKHTITFSKKHIWPSLYDYIRQDWALRHYEAVIVFEDKEMISGTSNITFSAYYYEGISREIPVPVGEENGDLIVPQKILPHPTRIKMD